MEKFKKNETYISLTDEILTIDDLRHISELKKVSVMWLQSCQVQDGNIVRSIQDKDLIFFVDLIKMEKLAITYSDISDHGLEKLANLKKLTFLNLIGSKIQGKGITHLSDCEKLETIWLSDSLLNDYELKHFEQLPKLTTLLMDDSKVTIQGVYSLAHLIHLAIGKEGEGIFTKALIMEFKKRQVELTLNGTVVNEQSAKEVSELITNFMSQITEIEENLNQLDKQEDSESLKIEQYSKFNSVFDIFCDIKAKRRYTEWGVSYQYFTYKDFVTLALHQVSKSKIHAYYLDYSTVRFELVLKNGEWKLAGLQRGFNTKWTNIGL